MDKHAYRIEIFNSTLALLRQGWYVAQDGRKVALPPVAEVMDAAVMYSEPFRAERGTMVPVATELRVENKDCVMAAKELIDAGYNPAMLNLADLYTPGGLVEYGSGAQEENLCRRSNLILSLYQFSQARVRQYPDLGLRAHADQYPMDERYGGVYSGVVTFFRGSESGGSQLEGTPYNIPVISVAALCGPRIGADGMMLPEETEVTLEKMRTIFRIGQAQGHDSLVLSALGCGAFANPPAHIARLFHQVIEEDEFRNTFRLIDFAILDGYKTGLRHNPEGNLVPFQREFGDNHFMAPDRIARIRKMEEIYDRVRKDIATLREYEESGLWLQDYEADERGELPRDLKRGVLSQDGLDEVFEDASALQPPSADTPS